MRKALIPLISLLILAACASDGPKVKAPVRPTNIQNIGVVSLMGDAIELTSSGFVGMGADYDRAFLPYWRLKDLIVYTAGADLSSAYKAVPVAINDEQMRRFVDPAKVPNLDALRKGLQASLTDGNTADAYLVITPNTLQDPVFQSLSDLTGIGIFHWTAIISSDAVYPFVIGDMTLIDAHDFHIISTTPLKVLPKDSYKTLGYPIQTMDGFDWKPKFAQMTPQQGQQLYGIWRNLLFLTIKYSMSQLKLS